MQRLLHIGMTLANRARFLWWRVRKPHVHGAKVIILSPEDEVLLIRHSYIRRDQWMLPGGGIGRKETPEQAALREIHEETGLCAGTLVLHGQFLDTSTGAYNHIHIFIARNVSGSPRIDGIEIIDARWFPINALPATLASASRARIDEVRKGRAPTSERWL